MPSGVKGQVARDCRAALTDDLGACRRPLCSIGQLTCTVTGQTPPPTLSVSRYRDFDVLPAGCKAITLTIREIA